MAWTTTESNTQTCCSASASEAFSWWYVFHDSGRSGTTTQFSIFFFLFLLVFGDGWQKNRVFFRKRWAAEEQESGVKGSFSPHLPSSAGDFKSLYECHFGDRMVFVPWQEISLSLIFWRCFPPMGGIDSHYIRYNPKRQSVRFVHPSIN